MKKFHIFKNGLLTGLILQLAIGPVFFFIVNQSLQKTLLDGLAGVLAVTIVDYFYITLSILGIGKILENKRVKKVFGFASSVVLTVFGIILIKGALGGVVGSSLTTTSTGLLSSFSSVFFLTVSSPMTIVFFTSLFTSKAIEYNYKKTELCFFGFGTGFATLIFMSTSVIVFSLIGDTIPVMLIHLLNLIVGFLLVGYGTIRLKKLISTS